MGKYFVLQLKRLLRLLLPVLLVAAILFGCLGAVYHGILALDAENNQQTKFQVALVGTAGNTYVELGLAMLGSFDSTRFSVEFVQMDEPEAKKAMLQGKLSAYMVIPEGFIDAAQQGNFLPVRFVSTVGATGLVSILKDEMTKIVETILVETQKGTYGAGNAAEAGGANGDSVIYNISLKYVEFVLARSKLYRVQESGIFDGLGLGGYLVSGLGVVLLLLICLSFAPMMIRRDHALSRMLCARRNPAEIQLLLDFAVYMTGLLAIGGVVLLLLTLSPSSGISLLTVVKGLPVLLALGAMSMLLYELVSDLVSGVLVQFFVSLALCFVSGCMYPIAFFPETLQKLSAFLPTGLARMQLADCLRGGYSPRTTVMLLAFAVLFLGIAMIIRKTKVAGIRG